MPFMPPWLLRIFKRSVKTTLERLEEIENDILTLESTRTTSIDTEKRLNFRLIVYSLILFGIVFIWIFYYYWPTTQTGKLILWTVVLIYPSIISLLKWLFRAFFSRSVTRTDERLRVLREEKQRLLEEVMENETFNKAQMILKRFDPLMFTRLTALDSDYVHTPKSTFKQPSDASVLRSRRPHGADGDNISLNQTPLRQVPLKDFTTSKLSVTENTENGDTKTEDKTRLLRPILPRDRSLVDKLLDALVGDGPDKRYALICRQCASHNGMALQEEFEFLAFRCCYCSHFNPPRLTRQRAPIPSNIKATPTARSVSSIDLRFSTSNTPRSCTPNFDRFVEQKNCSVSSSPLSQLDDFEPTMLEDTDSDRIVTAESPSE